MDERAAGLNEESAYRDLMDYLEDGEDVEGIVFGGWGWSYAGGDCREEADGWLEPDPTPVPLEKRGRVLSLEEAAPMMRGWSFYGGCGEPNCFAAYIWTDRRVIWVTQYHGSTKLDAAPRNPEDVCPEMPGQDIQ